MTPPRVFTTASELRRELARGGGAVGFVPTMGALHAGHLSLVRRAALENARVVVSIFVNPTQFGEKKDFSAYPRDLRADRRLLAGGKPPLVYAPEAGDVYPPGFATALSVEGPLGRVLEAEFRPGHFTGVATVVARLLALVRPQRAYFGLKDYQQFLVVRRLALDLDLPVEVIGCPIVRETDGLAMSSRNVRLGAQARAQAPALQRALLAAASLAARGEGSCARLRQAGARILRGVPGLKLQYFEVADPETLLPLRRLDDPAVALAACVLGGVRLIDNLHLYPGPRPRAARRAAPGQQRGTQHA